LLNEQQMSAAARQWLEHASPTADAWAVPRERVGDGPFHVLVVLDGTGSPYGIRRALELFGGVSVPHLCQDTARVLTGRMTLHVVPHLVFEELADRQWFGIFGCGRVDHTLDLAPFTSPPTEADMVDVLIRALSSHVPPGRRRDRLGRGVRHACDALGWRRVAALVGAMDEDTRADLADVVAVLAALTSAPESVRVVPARADGGQGHPAPRQATPHIQHRRRGHRCPQ